MGGGEGERLLAFQRRQWWSDESPVHRLIPSRWWSIFRSDPFIKESHSDLHWAGVFHFRKWNLPEITVSPLQSFGLPAWISSDPEEEESRIGPDLSVRNVLLKERDVDVDGVAQKQHEVGALCPLLQPAQRADV